MKEYDLTIEGERVYLKKDFLGWRIINPIKIEGKINYINLLFGGYRNLILLIIFILIVVSLYFGVNEIIYSYKLIADNPCKFCSDCMGVKDGLPYNLSLYP